jgi:hypothetical protein
MAPDLQRKVDASRAARLAQENSTKPQAATQVSKDFVSFLLPLPPPIFNFALVLIASPLMNLLLNASCSFFLVSFGFSLTVERSRQRQAGLG